MSEKALHQLYHSKISVNYPALVPSIQGGWLVLLGFASRVQNQGRRLFLLPENGTRGPLVPQGDSPTYPVIASFHAPKHPPSSLASTRPASRVDM